MHPKIKIRGSIFDPHSGSLYDHNQAQDTYNSPFLAFSFFLIDVWEMIGHCFMVLKNELGEST